MLILFAPCNSLAGACWTEVLPLAVYHITAFVLDVCSMRASNAYSALSSQSEQGTRQMCGRFGFSATQYRLEACHNCEILKRKCSGS